MAEKQLTDKQKLFLDKLFGEAEGDVRTAMTLAGYSTETDSTRLVAALREEILDRTNQVLASNAPKAAMAFGKIIDGEAVIGAKELIATAKEVLDRVGLVKVERIDHTISSPNGLFILPPKKEINTSDE